MSLLYGYIIISKNLYFIIRKIKTSALIISIIFQVLKTCETLSAKGDILCKMSDYQSAKQVLLKAWKLKTPDEEEMDNIETNLKVGE